MQIDKRKKERRTKSRNDATAAIALASAVGTRFAIFFLSFVIWRPFLDPSKRNVWICFKLLKYGNFEWQITQRTRIETWSAKDQLYLSISRVKRQFRMNGRCDVVRLALKIEHKKMKQ